MTKTFVMTSMFDQSWAAMGLDDSDLLSLQTLLLVDPEAGDLMPRCGGARKVRVAAKSHGKRGGARVVYVDIVYRDEIYLLLAYPKNEMEKLTAVQEKALRQLVKSLKE